MIARKPLVAPDPETLRRLLRTQGYVLMGRTIVPINATPEEVNAIMATENPVPASAQIPTPPAAGAIIGQKYTRILALAGVVMAALYASSELGLLPTWVGQTILGLSPVLAALGVASPGIRKA